MRRTRPFLLASLVLAAPVAAAGTASAQVTIDPNALNRLGSPSLPEPPPTKSSGPAATGHRYKHRHSSAVGANHGTHPAQAEEKAAGNGSTPGKTVPGAKPGVILPPAAARTENKSSLGSSFATVPVLPGAIPPAPTPPKITVDQPATKKPEKPKPESAPPAVTPLPSLPAAVPPPAPAPAAATPAAIPAELSPNAAAPAASVSARAAKPPVAPAPAAPAQIKPNGADDNTLPPGADQLTLPFAGQDTDVSDAVPALIRDFVSRHGTTVLYVVRAFASQPKGDDDPSSPRRIALTRAQGVQEALTAAGVDPIHIRLLALGNAGGTPADRVDLIAMPASSGHTAPSSSP